MEKDGGVAGAKRRGVVRLNSLGCQLLEKSDVGKSALLPACQPACQPAHDRGATRLPSLMTATLLRRPPVRPLAHGTKARCTPLLPLFFSGHPPACFFFPTLRLSPAKIEPHATLEI